MGLLEDIQDQNRRVEALLGQVLDRLQASESPVWKTPSEICEAFRLERRMFKELLNAGVAAGKVKTIVFSPASTRQQQRIDINTFSRFLEEGGITE